MKIPLPEQAPTEVYDHTNKVVYAALNRITRRAGLRHIGWHVLRHSFASQLAATGVPIIAIKELLGHSDINMTMRYAHLAPSTLRTAVSIFDARRRYVVVSNVNLQSTPSPCALPAASVSGPDRELVGHEYRVIERRDTTVAPSSSPA